MNLSVGLKTGGDFLAESVFRRNALFILHDLVADRRAAAVCSPAVSWHFWNVFDRGALEVSCI